MRRLVAGLVLAIITVLSLHQGIASADVNDFVIHNFDGRYELFNDINGGRMDVVEKIDLTFSDQNHGILRAIPTDYNDSSLKLDIKSVSRDGSPEQYTTYGENNNEVLKIGDPNSTITGAHSYEIRYEMTNIIRFYEGHDEWYWDINGDQWQQVFENVKGEVVFPEGWDDSGLPEASCYTASESSAVQDCEMARTDRGYKFAITSAMSPYQTLTVAVPTQKGLFSPRTTKDALMDNIPNFIGLGTGLALSTFAFSCWYKWGKDHKGRGTIVPEYEPPNNLSPAEVGLLYDYTTDNRDITATLIDLAVRGYIKIHDDENKVMGLFKSRKFSLELTNDSTSSLKDYEKSLLDAIFDPMTAGTIQELKSINKSSMQTTLTTIRSSLKKTLSKEYGLLDETPGKAYLGLVVVFVVGILMLFAGPNWGWRIGGLIALFSIIVFGALMHRRSHAGVEAYEKIQGLRLYLSTAEKDRLAMLQSVDRSYAAPSRTVELFEKLLPYAVALGVEKSWAKQFDDIYSQSPDWYTGNRTSLSSAYIASSLVSNTSTFASSFSASTASSSSGSGGGGFSGGGGGGGGGGGW